MSTLDSKIADKTPQWRDSALKIAMRQQLSPGMIICLFLYYGIAKRLPDSPMPGSRLSNKLRVLLAGRLFRKVGNSVKIHSGVCFGTGLNIEIGDYSSLNHDCWIANDTIIGNDVMMGPEVIILSGSHNFNRTDIPMREQGAPPRKPVVVGDDVWIGTRSIILPGVKIGSHSIIGAGSVVTKDVEEWSVMAGNPAKFIRSRVADRANI